MVSPFLILTFLKVMARVSQKSSLQPLVSFIAIVGMLVLSGRSSSAAPLLNGPFSKSELAPAETWQVIHGTGSRNNPLRQKLSSPFSGKDLYVRFDLIYEAEGIDQPDERNGEFFVLWLDQQEGNDLSTHNGQIANIGIHVSENRNSFMVRFASRKEAHANVELKGGHRYRVLARLGKSIALPDASFDELDLWIDPKPQDKNKPHASTNQKGGLKAIEWLGFSTGVKTEEQDTIRVSQPKLSETWEDILNLPALETAEVIPPKPRIDFAKQVYPILKQHCFECHSGPDAKQGVRLDLIDEFLNQVHPGDANRSPLIHKVTALAKDERMPPPDHDPLPKEAIGILIDWIDQGVSWNESLLPSPVPSSDHWAFQPINRPELPDTQNKEWIQSPIDAFILAKKEAAGIRPIPPADDYTLKRRISLDLTGLPASQHPWLADDSESPQVTTHSLNQWSEKLLSSRAYGERWGRHWLDIARFAESNGHQHNRDRPYAWRYRDYVIESFQNDRPFDEFIKQQVAGDELPYSDENIIATGFLGAARYSGNELDKDIQRNDILVDIANTTANAFMGLTMECVQCHTHKFDPITIRDYYRFQAFFTQGQPGNFVLAKDAEKARPLIKRRWEIFDQVHARLTRSKRRQGVPKPVLVIPKSVVNGMSASEKKEFNTLEKQIAALTQAWGYQSTNALTATAPFEMRWPLDRSPQELKNLQTRILLRGDINSKGPVVSPGWPAVFGATETITSKPRTTLANWLTSSSNPLTARVWVNRIWQWHFGKGLVETSADFGTQGTLPTHPQLLDWLADELIQSGWSTKHIHRLILQSATYQQSSTFDNSNHEKDPKNQTYWRWVPRRLEAESIRDMTLALSNQLTDSSGGPSVPIAKADSFTRRSIYLQQKRDRTPLHQSLFDAPTSLTTCSKRRVSTVALQPLYLLNSDFMQRTASEIAALCKKQNPNVSNQNRASWLLSHVLERPASIEELKAATAHLEKNGLESLCLVLLNLNETLYIP